MADIELKISNPNNNDYPAMVLRKFFHMVFISPDGKKLNIYTATVFGGVRDEGLIEPSNKLVCTYADKIDCSLKFEYGSSENLINSVSVKDLTKELWRQTDFLKKVWGDCEKLESQSKVVERFQSLYPGIKAPNLNIESDYPIYYFHEEGKQNSDCIVTQGKFKKTTDNKQQNSYILLNQSTKHDGIEFMNWIKSEIMLTESILDRDISFKISLNDEAQCKYYTPDFTWYFAPPEGYIVDAENATVDFTKSSERNMVQHVAGDTTIGFEEWIKDEGIKGRQKSRVNLNKEISGNPLCISECKRIEVKFSIKNPHKSENRQFIMGLIIAFVLSFCADKTRLNDYHDCITGICNCPEGKCLCEYFIYSLSFLFPLMALLSYVSLVFNTNKCVPVEKKWFFCLLRAIKVLGILFSILTILYVFLLWTVFTPLMTQIVSGCVINGVIIGILMAGGMIFNMVYLIYCIVYRKKKVVDYI